MGPVDYQEAIIEARKFDALVKATDFNPKHWVRIIDEEGSLFMLRSAFAIEWGRWYFILAEHHDPKIFAKNDVESIICLMETEIPVKKENFYD